MLWPGMTFLRALAPSSLRTSFFCCETKNPFFRGSKIGFEEHGFVHSVSAPLQDSFSGGAGGELFRGKRMGGMAPARFVHGGAFTSQPIYNYYQRGARYYYY